MKHSSIKEIGYKSYPELYLDWFNNFLTTKGFSEYHGIDIKEAEQMIDTGKALYESQLNIEDKIKININTIKGYCR